MFDGSHKITFVTLAGSSSKHCRIAPHRPAPLAKRRREVGVSCPLSASASSRLPLAPTHPTSWFRGCRCRLGGRWRRRCGSGLPAQPDLPCEVRTPGGVGRGHHRVVPRKPPALPVLVWRQVVAAGQIPLERLHLPAVLE